jgi:3-deoxy-D-manno-octulosonic acid kinase
LLDTLHASGLPVPRPVAARYVRSGVVYRADLITEELPTRRTVAQALADAPLDAVTWQAIGANIGRLHARGVQHADLNAHNLLLGDDGAVYVLDFDRGRIRPRGAWEQDVLGRLRRSLVKVTADLPPGRFDDAAWAELARSAAGA